MRAENTRTINVLQGEYRLSDDPKDILTTLLGSCVATCLSDPVAGVGGLNHFLLPQGGPGDRDSLRYGINAMECLLNALLKAGASRSRIEAKVFGGARMIPGLRHVGQSNAEFADWFLRSEGIRIVGGSTGGDRGRRLRFRPTTGHVQQMLFAPQGAALVEEPAGRPTGGGSVTLF